MGGLAVVPEVVDTKAVVLGAAGVVVIVLDQWAAVDAWLAVTRVGTSMSGVL